MIFAENSTVKQKKKDSEDVKQASFYRKNFFSHKN